MNAKEVSERYMIPMEILKEYEEMGLCSEVKKVMNDWHYDEKDMERLSLIMTLHDIGFTNREVERYMELLVDANRSAKERMDILNKTRAQKLDAIHFQEKQLERLDYLRYEIRKFEKGGLRNGINI